MNLKQDHSYLKVFLTNVNAYASGQLQGEWLSLPTDSETLQSVFRKIGLADGGEYFITDYECSAFPALKACLGEYENLNELNYLAAKLKEVLQSSVLTDEFSAALKLGNHTSSVMELINLTEPHNLNSFTFLTEVHNNDELGRAVVQMGNYDLQAIGELAQYIDYEALGRDTCINEGGIFTNRAYFAPSRDGLYEFYKSVEDIPQEYLITVDATQTAAEAMAENMSAGMTMG